MTTPSKTIRVQYLSVDGVTKSGKWKTLAGARRFATKWVGETPEVGTYYAVSPDGIGRVTWDGCTAAELFPTPEREADCGKCGGAGRIGEYSHNEGGVCFHCKGTGVTSTPWNGLTNEHRFVTYRKSTGERVEGNRRQVWAHVRQCPEDFGPIRSTRTGMVVWPRPKPPTAEVSPEDIMRGLAALGG